MLSPMSTRELLNQAGVTPATHEMRSTTIFDTLDLLAAAESPLFVGLASRSSDKALTNIEQPNSLPSPDQFVIAGVSVLLSANGAAADIAKILEKSTLLIKLGGRVILECPLAVVAYQGAATVGQREIYELEYPQVISPGARIEGYILTRTAAAAAVSTQVALHGVRYAAR